MDALASSLDGFSDKIRTVALEIIREISKWRDETKRVLLDTGVFRAALTAIRTIKDRDRRYREGVLLIDHMCPTSEEEVAAGIYRMVMDMMRHCGKDVAMQGILMCVIHRLLQGWYALIVSNMQRSADDHELFSQCIGAMWGDKTLATLNTPIGPHQVEVFLETLSQSKAPECV